MGSRGDLSGADLKYPKTQKCFLEEIEESCPNPQRDPEFGQF
jgi:hypothetical protein